MNKIILANIILVAVLLTACGNYESASTNTPASTSNSKPSFGLYDISSSGTSSSQPATAPVANTSSYSDQTRLGSGSGSGGGGGGRNEPAIVALKISMEQTTASQINTAPTDRKIIRNAELNLEAENPEQAQQQITAIAELKGGFVVESQQSSSDIKSTTRDTVVMTVRVPAEKFGETLDEIRKTASRVVVENVKGQDVTEEFIDIEAQLKAKKALEQQFMEIMKRANTVDDALSVQSQLAEVRGEIEKIEGRKRFLENQASLSTIKIRLQTAKVFAASSEGFGDRVAESFSRGFDIALNFILGLVTLVIGALPFALFVGVPGYFLARSIMRRRNRPMSVSEIAKEEIQNE
ncbi:MAG: DUF4349 domain-containing protein [Pyrinomonadaceae bacterium]